MVDSDPTGKYFLVVENPVLDQAKEKATELSGKISGPVEQVMHDLLEEATSMRISSRFSSTRVVADNEIRAHQVVVRGNLTEDEAKRGDLRAYLICIRSNLRSSLIDLHDIILEIEATKADFG